MNTVQKLKENMNLIQKKKKELQTIFDIDYELRIKIFDEVRECVKDVERGNVELMLNAIRNEFDIKINYLDDIIQDDIDCSDGDKYIDYTWGQVFSGSVYDWWFTERVMEEITGGKEELSITIE